MNTRSLIVLSLIMITTTVFAQQSTEKTPVTEPAAAAPAEAPPLPFHTIEGYGGGAITPMAYLVNPGPKDAIFGAPAAAFSYVNLGHKNLEAFTFTETLFQRIELGYGLDRLGLGTLPHDIKEATTVDINRDQVYLHNFNLRGLLLEENSFDTQILPAVTAGAHFKVNEGIADINHILGGALESIGYEKSNGVDYTLTASKLIPNVFSRPLIVSAGLRNSEAAQLGFLGFGDDRTTTFEGNVAYLPTDWLLVAYEFRQKANPYDKIPGLVDEEDNWHAVDVSWIANAHTTVVAGWGAFGNLANAEANGAWWMQVKYEF
jgi:hypothetical protein